MQGKSRDKGAYKLNVAQEISQLGSRLRVILVVTRDIQGVIKEDPGG